MGYFSQRQTFRFESPAVENFLDIKGKTYATGAKGKGLYCLIDEDKAYFYNEAYMIQEDFKLDRRKNIEKQYLEAIKKYKESKANEE